MTKYSDLFHLGSVEDTKTKLTLKKRDKFMAMNETMTEGLAVFNQTKERVC